MSSAQDRITLRQQIVGTLFAAPYLVGFSVFLIVPLAMALYYSFTDYSILNDPAGIGIDNYRRILHDARFYKVVWNTLIFSLSSVPLSLTTAILMAILLNQKVPGRAAFRTIIFLPSLVPGVASAMIWLWILNAKQGLLNEVLRLPLAWLHLAPPNWLGSPALAMPTLIGLSVWGIGNTVVIFLAGLQDIPVELYEAAHIDGAGPWQRLIHVTLPTLSPVIFFNLIMGIIGSWQFFETPYILTGGGPNRATESYTMYLMESALTFLNMGYASALAWVQFLIIVSATGVVIWTSRKWVHYQ